MALEELDLSRRRYLMQQVMRKVQGWQSIWMTSELDCPSTAKGRYLAAKEFYDWLADGGEISKAEAFLDERSAYWKRLEEEDDLYIFALTLEDHIRAGHETRESLRGYRHALIDGINATPEEREKLKFLQDQHGASQVENWHLKRFLKDPFVSGQTSEPPPPPPRAVVDETEYEDENDEPDAAEDQPDES